MTDVASTIGGVPVPSGRTAGIVVIGNEILSGKVTDLNSPFLARELRALGVSLRRVEVVPDEVEVIAEAVARMSRAYDFVFTSGGIGPTHDDKTVEAVAMALEREVVRSPLLVELLTEWYGSTLNDARLRMADVPEGAEVVYGGHVKVPAVFVDNVLILPGIPDLLQKEFTSLRDRFACAPYHCRRAWVTLMEGDIAGILDAIERGHDGVDVGSYPVMDETLPYRVLLTFDGKNQAAVEAALARLLEQIPADSVHRVE